tara:strand:+ start:1217 stop:1504 length:288 start_codon:yes stop_codon:yes gene_type:complete
MTVTVVTTFIKEDASTRDYSNPEIKKVLDEYEKSNKIIKRSSWKSEDGLTQKRTRVYADQASFDAFLSEPTVLNNRGKRYMWCKAHGVKVTHEIT